MSLLRSLLVAPRQKISHGEIKLRPRGEASVLAVARFSKKFDRLIIFMDRQKKRRHMSGLGITEGKRFELPERFTGLFLFSKSDVSRRNLDQEVRLGRPRSTARHRVVLGRDNSGRMSRSKKASAPVPGPLSRVRVDVASIPGNPSFDKHPPFEDRDEWLPHTHRLLLSFAQGALGQSLGSCGSAHPWDALARLWSAPRARPQGDSL